jgi:hypothetical protein
MDEVFNDSAFFNVTNHQAFIVGYVLYSLHVCVCARQVRQLHLKIPRTSALIVLCASGTFLWGSQGGAGMPPGYAQYSGQRPKILFLGGFFYF